MKNNRRRASSRLPVWLAAAGALSAVVNTTPAQTPVRQWYVEAPQSQSGDLGLDPRVIGSPAAEAFIVPWNNEYFVGFKDGIDYEKCFPDSGLSPSGPGAPVCFQLVRNPDDFRRPGRHLLLNFIPPPEGARAALVRTIVEPDGRCTIFVEPRP